MTAAHADVRAVELGLLRESKTNPRQTFEKVHQKELVATIKTQGIVVPLLLRPLDDKYEIVCGHRRFRAAQELKLETVPAIVRNMTDAEVLNIQVIENEQRADVHPLEQCIGYKRLMDSGLKAEEVAARIGKPLFHVKSRLQFLNLIEPAQKWFLCNRIGATHALQIARLQQSQQKEVLSWFRGDDEMSAYRLADQIRRNFFLKLAEAPFDIKDEKLVPAAGSCLACPKRTGADSALFPDVKEQDTCTDPKCFEDKTRAFIKIAVGTHPDAILLTQGRSYISDAKPKGLTGWTRAGNKECKHTKEGIVVEIVGHSDDQKAKLGQVLTVCTNEKCRTHHQVPDYDTQTGHSRKADKTRKIELRRRGLIFKGLAADKFAIKDADHRTVLDWAIETLSSDNARALCQAMEWPILEGKYTGKDYTGTIKKNLAKLTADGVKQWTYLLMLADTDLWFYAGSGKAPCKNLEAKAKAAGVPLATIAKLSKEKPKKPAAKAKVRP